MLMTLLCLFNRSRYGPAVEARRWNARAWPGNTTSELSKDEEHKQRFLMVPCIPTARNERPSQILTYPKLNHTKTFTLNHPSLT